MCPYSIPNTEWFAGFLWEEKNGENTHEFPICLLTAGRMSQFMADAVLRLYLSIDLSSGLKIFHEKGKGYATFYPFYFFSASMKEILTTPVTAFEASINDATSSSCCL